MTKRIRGWGGVVFLVGLPILRGLPGWAGEEAQEVAQFLSDANKPLIGAGTAGLYLCGKEEGRKRAEQIIGAEVVSLGVSEALKRLTKEQRPDGSDRLSFPSAHASSAFTFAEVLAEHDREHQGWYYGGAALIGWSRVELRKHYWWDVVAGAALGIYSARLLRDQPLKLGHFSLGGRDCEASLGIELHGQGLTLLQFTW